MSRPEAILRQREANLDNICSHPEAMLNQLCKGSGRRMMFIDFLTFNVNFGQARREWCSQSNHLRQERGSYSHEDIQGQRHKQTETCTQDTINRQRERHTHTHTHTFAGETQTPTHRDTHSARHARIGTHIRKDADMRIDMNICLRGKTYVYM